MKTIVASWDRHRIKDTIRTKMGGNPLAYPHAFRSPEAPRELTEVFAASGSNQEFFDKLEELGLMSTFQTFFDNYATHSLSYEFGYLESLNGLALAIFTGDHSLGADFRVEQANFGQGPRPTLLFHATTSEELLDKILPMGTDSWRLIKTATGQFVLQADTGGTSEWFVIETLDRRVAREVSHLTEGEAQLRAMHLGVSSRGILGAEVEDSRALMGGAA